MPVPTDIIPSQGGDALRRFQLLASVQDKSNYDWGKSIAQDIAAKTFDGVGTGYFWSRNARFKQNRDMASGRMDTTKFMDRMDMNGKFNYINLNWQAIKIVNTIVSKIVGRWMSRSEKIVVSAIDSLSTKDKEEGYQQAEFLLNHRRQLEQLQQQSGVQLIPQNQFVPNDQEELDLWMAEYQRIPEEILYETGINDVLDANGMFDVNKEKLLHDSCEAGLVCTYTWMDGEGVIHVDWIKPENHFYSYSEYSDLHDCSWKGDMLGMKISEIRRRFGKQFGGKLSEEEIWNIAQTAKDYQRYDKLRWLTEWGTAYLRPYDEWNVDVMRFELKSVDIDPYTLVQTKKFDNTLIKKGRPEKLGSNEEYVEDKNVVIYQGMYIRQQDIMLSWGLKENMIRPNDPKEIGDCLFSYSTYMYQNNDMRNVAVPEKIQEPVEQMILARLKMQQVVMTMKPPGTAINQDALQEIDFGLGDKNKLVDPKKYYDQTGTFYYRGRDAEGNPIPVPFQELQNSGFLPAMNGLIQVYEFHYKVLKDELGEDPSIVTQAAQPRVSEGNVQTSLQQAEYATDYMYDPFLYVMEQTSKRIACLLHTSVDFGAQAYRHIMSEEDIKGRVFSTRIKMLPTQQEMAMLEGFMNQSIQSNPELVMFCDPAKVMRIAREDVKLAEWYFRQCQKKMWKSQQEAKAQDQQANIESQRATAQDTAQGALQLEREKAQLKNKNDTDLSTAEKEKIALQGYFDCKKAGVSLPPQLEQEIITNVLLPLFAQNQSNKMMLAQASQMESEQPQQNQIQQPPPQAA